MRKKGMLGLSLLAASGLVLAGCAGDTPDTEGGGEQGDGVLDIGFFGFAASNSFAQGTYIGVEQAAEAAGANATFVDGQFDGQVQVQQINDAITTGDYDIIIIQANDNLAVQEPLQRAVDAGITVVIEFTAVGPDFSTAEPQVDGAISIVDPAVTNGEVLGEMAVMACEEVGDGCQVAYMEGFRSLPLDNARTEAVLDRLEEEGGIEVLPTVEGGYSQDEGRAAFQDIVQSAPDVDVVIGSSQAIAGAYLVAGEDSGIYWIANGAPQSAVQYVLDGDWYGIYALDIVTNGATAAEYGIAHANGEEVPMATNQADLAPNGAVGIREALEEAGFESGYDE